MRKFTKNSLCLQMKPRQNQISYAKPLFLIEVTSKLTAD